MTLPSKYESHKRPAYLVDGKDHGVGDFHVLLLGDLLLSFEQEE